MKRYFCDMCNKELITLSDHNKLKITECWDNSTYSRLLCNDCICKVFKLLRGGENEKQSA